MKGLNAYPTQTISIQVEGRIIFSNRYLVNGIEDEVLSVALPQSTFVSVSGGSSYVELTIATDDLDLKFIIPNIKDVENVKMLLVNALSETIQWGSLMNLDDFIEKILAK